MVLVVGEKRKQKAAKKHFSLKYLGVLKGSSRESGKMPAQSGTKGRKGRQDRRKGKVDLWEGEERKIVKTAQFEKKKQNERR